MEAHSGKAFSKYWKTVAVPIAPLDDSNGAVVYEDVVAWVHRYKALFTARDSVMVLPELLNAYCGIGMEICWLLSTNNTGGTGRSYDSALFCLADRMVWITGLTDVYRGRIAEDWGMDALEEVFGVRLNRHPSSLRRTDIGVDKPNVCYMMPVYEYLGTSAQFQEERQRLRVISSKNTQLGSKSYADLGKRFLHPRTKYSSR